MTDSVKTLSDMIYNYSELFDTGDFDGFAAQFEHGRWHRAEPGIAATRQWIADHVQVHDGLPRTKHVITNLIVDVDEDACTATSRSYITVWQAVPPELPLQAVFSGRYRDRFERVDGEWRWLERSVLADLYGDTSKHVR
jgi:3-phenylpropionate/cinnamic acid dioxygenase small subunit